MATWKTTELATALSVTVRRVNQMVKDGTLPAPRNGQHDPFTSVPAYLRFIKESDEKQTLLSTQQRKCEVEAQIKEHELMELQSILIRSEQVEAVWAQAAAAIRAKVLGIPTKCAPLVMGVKTVREAKAILDKQIHEALSELSRLRLQPVRAAARLDGEPVGGPVPPAQS